MKTPHSTTPVLKVALAAMLGLVVFGASPAAFAASDLLVPDFADVVSDAAAAVSTVDAPDSVTVATTCVTCRAGLPPRNPYRRITERVRRQRVRPAAEQAPPTSAFEEKLGLVTWREAIAGRYTARFRGHKWRSGNRSKSMCASVVKDILLEMGVCTSRPDGDAIDLYNTSSLVASCPRVSKNPSNSIAAAKKASIIIYSGHVSRKKHSYGHIEMKIPVTAALKKKIGRDGFVGHVPVGGYIYCSDFCRAKPSANKTAKVAAVYEITGGRE